MDEQNLLVADNLGICYSQKFWALRGVELTLQPGEFVGIVGLSGCGKSTLLRALAGLVLASEGKVQKARQLQEISFVFQSPTLLPWRNVYQNVCLPLELSSKQEIGHWQQRIEQTLTMVGLQEFREAYPHQLSGGMKMRASLARGLIKDPQLLLMDEPFGALDEITRQRLNEELLQLWLKRKWSTVFVTHSVYEAVFLSQRVLVMSHRPGRFLAEVAVPFAYPRRAELRSQAEFANLCGEVSRYLQQAERATSDKGVH